MVDALGTVGSMASGIIEYLAEGAWTKRLHAGWAAQSGLRAALLGRAGFLGPRTVFEGVHGFFHGFANTTKGDFDAIAGDFGERWVTETLAFKPYPCGTMTHPYIDCARRLGEARQGRRYRRDGLRSRRGHRASACGSRLPSKHHPKNGYAGKFSSPYCIATGFVRGNVGLSDFTDAAVKDPAVLAVAGKVRYQIDPNNPYPEKFHRPHPRQVARRLGDRRAPALYARRRAGAADPRRYRAEVFAQRQARRLERRARGGGR